MDGRASLVPDVTGDPGRRQFLGGLASLLAPMVLSDRASGHPAPDTTPRDIGPQLATLRAKHGLPALAAALLTSERTVSIGVAGTRQYGTDVAVTLDDKFHLGSCTKAMTATLLGLLVDEGRLAWNWTLERLLPDLATAMHPAYRSLGLEQVLAHRSGFSSESWPRGLSSLDVHRFPGSPLAQRRTYVEKIMREPPEAEPGTRFIYSNRNYAVAGAIAERITGVSWEDLMNQKVFRPLGMSTAGFGSMGTPGRVDQPWQHRWAGEKRVPIAPGPLSDNPAAIGPAGTVHCSIGDWAKFISAHLPQPSRTSGLLKPETLERLHTPSPGGTYGFGWLTVERPWAGGPALTHTGTNTGNFAVAWLAPARDFAVLAATNQGGQGAFSGCDEAVSVLIRSRAQ